MTIELTDKKIFVDLYELGTHSDNSTLWLLVPSILLILFATFWLFFNKISKIKNSEKMKRLNNKKLRIIMIIVCGVTGILETMISIAMGFCNKEKLPNQNWYVKIESVNDIVYHQGIRKIYRYLLCCQIWR